MARKHVKSKRLEVRGGTRGVSSGRRGGTGGARRRPQPRPRVANPQTAQSRDFLNQYRKNIINPRQS